MRFKPGDIVKNKVTFNKSSFLSSNSICYKYDKNNTFKVLGAYHLEEDLYLIKDIKSQLIFLIEENILTLDKTGSVLYSNKVNDE